MSKSDPSLLLRDAARSDGHLDVLG
jgi:hypothetical protein